MQPIEDEKEAAEEKELKVSTPEKLLSGIPVLLAQVKAGNNSKKLKIEVKQILYLSYQHNKITETVYNNLFNLLQPKKFYFDLPEDPDINLMNYYYSIINHNDLLAEHIIKQVRQLLPNKNGGGDINDKKISKTNEPYKLSQRLDIKSLNKRISLQNLSIYYTWENIRQQYKNNKLKIIVPTWNDEFDLTDGSYIVSDVQNYT